MNVTLSDGTDATVSLFDIEHMILSLLSDESLMKDENLAPGYDIFTGDVDENHPHNKKLERYILGILGERHMITIMVPKGRTCQLL